MAFLRKQVLCNHVGCLAWTSMFESFGHFYAHFSEGEMSEMSLNLISHVKIRVSIKKKEKYAPSTGNVCNMIADGVNCWNTHMRERKTLWMSQPQEKLPWEFEINRKIQIFKKPDYVELGCVRGWLSNVYIFPLPRPTLYRLICSSSLRNLLRSQTSKGLFPEQGNGCQ